MINSLEPQMHELTLRIPGAWNSVREFADSLPAGFRLDEHRLSGPGGLWVECQQAPADGMFPLVFSQACIRPASEDEQATIADYQMNVILLGPCGGLGPAAAMMDFAAAVVRGGGAGVFIDNSARAHGAGDWLQLVDAAQRRDVEAMLWAFVSIVSGESEIYSIGAHVLGQRDVRLQRGDDLELDAETLKCFVLKELSGIPVLESEVVDGPSQVRPRHEESNRFRTGLPMYNPLGQWHLERVEAD